MRGKLVGIAILLLVGLLLAGCGSDNPAQIVKPDVESDSVLAAPVDVSGYSELRITSYNLNMLYGFGSGAYSSERLLWQYGQQLDATYERNWYGYTQHADNYGNYWGQCVSSVKALSKNNLPTSYWLKGRRVIRGCVSSGTAIATFDATGKYYGHCAMMNAYTADGIQVWDQNWAYDGIFRKHRISCSGSGVADADNYYVVMIP